jgi:hypothetical protein
MKRSFIWILLTVFLTVMVAGSALADSASNQQYTAYANMSLYGASNQVVDVGDVAVHPRSDSKGCATCSIIPFGITIFMDTPSSIAITKGDGYTYNYNQFIVQDTGDLMWYYHPSSYYWIDIYFGRWMFIGDSCTCGGVGGTCYLGDTSSCANAVNFGSHSGGSWHW